MATPLIDEAVRILQEELVAVWESLDEEDRLAAERSVRDGADLLVRQVEGEDVSAELAEVNAQLRCWRYAGASIVRRAVVRTLQRWAVVVGRLLVSLAAGALGGLAEADGAVGELLEGLSE